MTLQTIADLSAAVGVTGAALALLLGLAVPLIHGFLGRRS